MNICIDILSTLCTMQSQSQGSTRDTFVLKCVDITTFILITLNTINTHDSECYDSEIIRSLDIIDTY